MDLSESPIRLLLVCTSLRSAYGGPARSVSRLASALVKRGVEVGLWSADGSVVGTPFLDAGSGVTPLPGTLEEAFRQFGRPHLLHDNGIWLPHNHAAAVLANREGIPRVVSLRGMLQPWAFRHKLWKKRVAWLLYQRRDLRSATCLHVTSESARRNAEARNLGVEIRLIDNGVDVPDPSDLDRAPVIEHSGRVALFVGRVYPVKGLPMLVDAWARVRPEGWSVRIVGPDEGGHRAELESQIRARGLEPYFEFVGEKLGADLLAERKAAELVVAPSHTENFGLAIAEALAAGQAVITTQGTPWSKLQSEGCGWWEDVSVDGMERALRSATACTPDELRQMGRRGRGWMQREFSWDRVASDFLKLYREISAD
jgi:glycosyltransferase involved in cell wall biosynthesis